MLSTTSANTAVTTATRELAQLERSLAAGAKPTRTQIAEISAAVTALQVQLDRLHRVAVASGLV